MMKNFGAGKSALGLNSVPFHCSFPASGFSVLNEKIAGIFINQNKGLFTHKFCVLTNCNSFRILSENIVLNKPRKPFVTCFHKIIAKKKLMRKYNNLPAMRI